MTREAQLVYYSSTEQLIEPRSVSARICSLPIIRRESGILDKQMMFSRVMRVWLHWQSGWMPLIIGVSGDDIVQWGCFTWSPLLCQKLDFPLAKGSRCLLFKSTHSDSTWRRFYASMLTFLPTAPIIIGRKNCELPACTYMSRKIYTNRRIVFPPEKHLCNPA